MCIKMAAWKTFVRLALICIVFSALFISTEGSKKSKKEKKSSEKSNLETDQLRASLGTIRDAFVRYVSNPAFSVGSELIIDKIIGFLSDVETHEIKEAMELLKEDPTLMEKLGSELLSGDDAETRNNDWKDPEKAIDLMRSAYKSFSELEDPQTYFHDLLKILATKIKKSTVQKDEL